MNRHLAFFMRLIALGLIGVTAACSGPAEGTAGKSKTPPPPSQGPTPEQMQQMQQKGGS